jgi:hypothetical protein
LVVDAVDLRRSPRGGRANGRHGRNRDGAPFVWIENAAGFPYMFWVFHNVPEAKTVKNACTGTCGWSTPRSRAHRCRRTLLRPKDDEIHWWVMTDPKATSSAFE